MGINLNHHTEPTALGSRPMQRRTLLGAGLGLAGSAALAACTPGSATSTSNESTVSLMLLGASAETETMYKDKILKTFTEQSGVTVNIQTSDWGSGFQKVTTAAASGTLADVVMLGGIWVAPLASKGALLKLDDHLQDWTDRDNFYPAMIEDCRWQDSTYALPAYTETRTALYRKDLLETIGVSTDQLPTTWATYFELAKELAAKKPTGMVVPTDWFSDKALGLQQSFAQLMLQAGGTYYDSAGKATFGSDQGVKALEYLVSFYRDKLSDANLIYQGTGARPTAGGKTAMTFSGYVDVNSAKVNNPDAVPELFAGIPLMAETGGKPTTTAWIGKFGVSAKTKNPEGAVKLIKHLVSKDSAVLIGPANGGLPARKDLADADYLSGLNPGFVQASEYVITQPPNPNMLTIAQEINKSMQQATRLEGNPADVLKALDTKINQINGVA